MRCDECVHVHVLLCGEGVCSCHTYVYIHGVAVLELIKLG